ncbi:MAG: restriction endonuclease subunit S [Treponema sp.]|nr:restriction endonuclease subunit S [Treponema sp.]
MAKTKVKAKKKTEKNSLNHDEILTNALVPGEEQPYKIPDNWVWVRLNSVLDYEQPIDYIVESTDYNDNFNTPVLTAGKSFILGYTNETFGVYKKTPVIIFDDFTTDIKYVDFPFKVKSSAMKILFPITGTMIKYIYFYMQTVEYDHSNHQRFWISKYSMLPFPLPPLSEQQRIVNYIENLFENLDRAKELAQNALDSFETRKAAILHKAFSGELTAKWRKENGVKLESWEEKTLGNILLPMNVRKPKGNNFRYIDIDSINNDIQEVKAPKELLTKNAPSRASREVQEGDTLFSMVRPYLKNIAYIDKTLSDCIASTGFYVCRPSSQINPNFLHRFLTNDEVIMKINSYMKGDNSPSVRAEDIENTEILLPSLPEQQEIVRILDCLFEKEKRARELCDVIEKIDLMKKAILARAFRGELGTGDE